MSKIIKAPVDVVTNLTKVTGDLDKFVRGLKTAVSQADKIHRALLNAIPIEKLEQFEKIVSRLSKGSPRTQLLNANIGSKISEMNASPQGQFVRLQGAKDRLSKRSLLLTRKLVQENRLLTTTFSKLSAEEKKQTALLRQKIKLDQAIVDGEGKITASVIKEEAALTRLETRLKRTAELQKKQINSKKRQENIRISRLKASKNRIDERGLITTRKLVRENRLLTSVFRNLTTSEKRETLILQQKIRLDKSIIVSRGRITAAVKKQELALTRLETKIKTSIRLEKEQTRVANKSSKQRSAADVRKFSTDVRFGDGGAFLFKTQAALLAQFLIISKITQAFSFLRQFIVDLDKEFIQFQAITATTNTEMKSLRNTLIGVSEQTKFTAVEVAQAATILGQAGFSTKEIIDSISAVTLLATATGTDLKASVDVVTSVLSVFRLQASDTTGVVNLLTAAVNNSKLTMEKLTLGIQFASNVAFQSGVTLSELTSVLGGLADAGIRSGSTLGTGVRQILIELQKPSAALIKTMKRLGLSVNDIDIKSQGLIGVLRNLKDAGFTGSDGLKVFEKRASAALAAMLNQIDAIEVLRRDTILTGAAFDANAVQMTSLSNLMLKFQSIAGSVAATLTEDVLVSIKKFVNELSSGIQSVGKFSKQLKLFGSILSALALSAITVTLFRLIAGFKFFGTVAAFVSLELSALGSVITSTGARVIALSEAINVLKLALGPVAIITSLLSLGFLFFGKNTQPAGAALDKLTAISDQTKDALGGLKSAIISINTEIGRLSERANSLNGDERALDLTSRELQAKFTGMADILAKNDGPIDKVDELIEALQQLREETQQEFEIKFKGLANTAAATITILQETLKKLTSGSGFLDKLEKSGLKTTNVGQAFAQGRKLTPEQRSVVLSDKIDSAFVKEDIKRTIKEAILVGTGQSDKSAIQIKDLAKNLKGLVDAFKLDPNPDATKISILSAIAGAISDIANVKTKIAVAKNVKTSSDASIKLSKTKSTKSFKETQTGIDTIILDAEESLASANSVTGPIDKLFSEFKSKTEVSRKAIDDATLSLEKETNPDLVAAFKDAGLLTKLKEIRSKIAGQLLILAEKDAKLQVVTLGAQLRKNNKELKKITTDIRGENSVPRALDELQTIINKINPSILKIVKDKFEAANFDKLDEPAIKDAEKSLIDAEIEKGKKRVLQGVQSLGNVLTKQFTRMTAPFIQAGIEAEAVANAVVQNIQSKLKSFGNQANRGQVSRGAAFQVSEQLQPARQNALETRKSSLQSQKTAQKAALLALSENLTSLQKILKESNLNGEELVVTEGQVSVITDKLAKERIKLAKINSKLSKTEQDLLEFTKKQPLTIKEEVLAAIELFKKTSGVLDSIGKTIGDGLLDTLNAAKESFADLFTQFVKGTISMKQAFKSFGLSVIDSLLKIAATAVANGIFGLLANVAGQVFSGLLPGPSSSVSTQQRNLSTVKRPTIKPIRTATGGSVVGGVPNRDSVNTLLMPGEFVLRKSAVDAVGLDFLRNINSQGNSKIQQGAAAASSNLISPKQTASLVNVWVVSKDQVPPPGPNDIITTVVEDGFSGGPVKRLIKSVMMGTT